MRKPATPLDANGKTLKRIPDFNSLSGRVSKGRGVDWPMAHSPEHPLQLTGPSKSELGKATGDGLDGINPPPGVFETALVTLRSPTAKRPERRAPPSRQLRPAHVGAFL